MPQPIMNKVFYFNNNKGTRKDKKTFNISSIRKFYPYMFKPIRENTKKLSNLFHGQTQKL